MERCLKLEFDSLEATSTWAVTPLPSYKHAIGCKCMFKVKYKLDRTIERYKA